MKKKMVRKGIEASIEVAESWTRGKSAFSSIFVAEKMNGKAVDWFMLKKVFVGPEWYQVFSNLEGMKFNWLIKAWCKLNGLV